MFRSCTWKYVQYANPNLPARGLSEPKIIGIAGSVVIPISVGQTHSPARSLSAVHNIEIYWKLIYSKKEDQVQTSCERRKHVEDVGSFGEAE